MPETLKEGDFVELDYTGKLAEEGIVFDTTIEEVAKKNSIFSEGAKYGPVKVCIGKQHIVAGIDKNLAGKETGMKYVLKVSPEEGFGQKNPKMIQLISTDKFRKQGINPMPGLQVNIDGVIGMVKTVSGGRTVVDFNHPLSGKELEYEVSVGKVITDVNEKVNAVLQMLGLKMEAAMAGEKLTLKTAEDVPKELQENIAKAITDSVKEIKEVAFEKKEADIAAESKKDEQSIN